MAALSRVTPASKLRFKPWVRVPQHSILVLALLQFVLLSKIVLSFGTDIAYSIGFIFLFVWIFLPTVKGQRKPANVYQVSSRYQTDTYLFFLKGSEIRFLHTGVLSSVRPFGPF